MLSYVRKDGWPLCPRCEEDELWSPLYWDGQGERPALADYLAGEFTCYSCNWRGKVEIRTEVPA